MPLRGRDLAELRKGLGFTQAQVAEELGVARPVVSILEHRDEVGDPRVAQYEAALARLRERRSETSNQQSHPEE